ncbi:MAG: hypothetical protein JWP18_552 [Solirubrobacterales bacterium]|jgi:hypothetical protein|nr:hypothetical protein [Solirubrobacterales bacterium]
MTQVLTETRLETVRRPPYPGHPLHGPDRVHPETNCYTDVVIELLHARGDEPLAVLGPALRVDFEGDQWTFFKPEPAALVRLYGIDVHEMMPYRPLPTQLVEQLGVGRTLLVEVDAWYLPDTSGTSYRAEHVKTTIGVTAIDPDARRLEYVHNTGRHTLQGEDYDGLFHTEGAPDVVLPPYTELVRFDAGERLTGEALRAAARDELDEHRRRRPAVNPFLRFTERLPDDVVELVGRDDQDYHDYAFATVRMAGAAFELTGAHLRWTLGPGGEDAAQACDRIVQACKRLSFKLARRRPFDVRPLGDELVLAWATLMSELDRGA